MPEPQALPCPVPHCPPGEIIGRPMVLPSSQSLLGAQRLCLACQRQPRPPEPRLQYPWMPPAPSARPPSCLAWSPRLPAFCMHLPCGRGLPWGRQGCRLFCGRRDRCFSPAAGPSALLTTVLKPPLRLPSRTHFCQTPLPKPFPAHPLQAVPPSPVTHSGKLGPSTTSTADTPH